MLVVHDEIDLPFGDIRVRLGGGLAGHNGLKSLKRDLGGPDFVRVRVGVGRPDTTDPEIVSAHVLGRFSEPADEVAALVRDAADAAERTVLGDADGVPGNDREGRRRVTPPLVGCPVLPDSAAACRGGAGCYSQPEVPDR